MGGRRKWQVGDYATVAIFTLLGVGLLIGGIVGITTSDVKCGQSEMRSGDHCVISQHGNSQRIDYNERRSADNRGDWGMVLFGIGSLGAAGFYIFMKVKDWEGS